MFIHDLYVHTLHVQVFLGLNIVHFHIIKLYGNECQNIKNKKHNLLYKIYLFLYFKFCEKAKINK